MLGESNTVTIEDARAIGSVFFEEQTDLVSEVLSFLDVRSMLSACQTNKTITSCLRHEHVVNSALSRKSLSSETTVSPEISSSVFALSKRKPQGCDPDDTLDKEHQRIKHRQSLKKTLPPKSKEVIIMERLVNVFRNYQTLQNSNNAKHFETITKANIETPSSIRLLQLVNGTRCERCNCRLSPTMGCTNVPLPSLTFGKFLCTPCLFEPY